MQPLVSIIIPVYNRTALLRETIASVMSQTYTQWELIVVDDGSQEDVADVLPVDENGRMHLIQQNNQGNAAARNTGIQQAHGKYIACLDSDDIWDVDLLRHCVALLQKKQAVDVVYTQFQRIDALGQMLAGPAEPLNPPQGDLLADLLMGLPILPSSALARRTCFERWGAYTLGLDDWELWLRWAAGGCEFACLEQPLLNYRIHNQNLGMAWQSRRRTHFAMLDTFYNNDHLPEQAITLRAQAYANQHFLFCEMALQAGSLAAAQADFCSAFVGNPAYLTDGAAYYRLACAHQGRIEAGSEHNLDLVRAEEELLSLLDTLFAKRDLPPPIKERRPAARASAFLALAQVAYGIAGDGGAARRFLFAALKNWPPIVAQQDWSRWLLRSCAGQNRMQKTKAMLQSNEEQTNLARH